MFLVMNPWLWTLSQEIPVLLFFAILPPPDLWPVIGGLGDRLRRAHALDGHPIGLDRLHITLAPVFHGSLGLNDIVRRAIAVGDAAIGPAFPARLDKTVSFGTSRRKPFVLSAGEGLADLAAFQAELCKRLVLAGFDVRGGFTPHMTLVWADRHVEEEYPIAPISWEVQDFALICSYQGLSRYEVIRRWRLTPAGPRSSGERAGGQIADMAAIARAVPAAAPHQIVPKRR